MQAFLYLNLAAGKEAPYRQALLSDLRKELPNLALLDMDLYSDELTIRMAQRLLHEAEQTVVCIKAGEEQAGFGNMMPILEQLLTPHQNRLLLILGQPARLLRMLQARPHVYFKHVQTEAEIVEAVQVYFSAASNSTQMHRHPGAPEKLP